MFESTPLEKIILADILERTGLSFALIDGIDTRDKRIAEAVLPVLADWIDKVTDVSHRRAIYARFHSPYAYPHIEAILSWWTDEQDALALGILTQDIAHLVSNSNAERIWQLCKELPRRQSHYMLVSKLATFPVVESEAKEALVHALRTEALRAGDLSYVSQVNDPRIRQWFEGQVQSADRFVRAVARRAVARGKRLPRGLVYSPSAPLRGHELFSTEEDLRNLKKLLQKIGKDFRLVIPSALKGSAFLSSTELHRWMVAHISTDDGRPASLWFRLEDIDMVEIVVLEGKDEVVTVN